MLLYSETPNLHTHTLKVAVIDPADVDAEFGFDAFRHHVRRRLHLLEPLRYKLVDIPWQLHHPMWQENCEVDLDYHLRRVQVPAPGGRRELDQVDRRGGVHSAGPQPPAVGVSLRRGAGRRSVRPDRQGPPRAGRRRRLGQPAGARDGSAGRAHRRARQRRSRRHQLRRRAAARGRARSRPADRATAQAAQRCRRRADAGCAAAPGSAAITPTWPTRSTHRRPSSTTSSPPGAGSPARRYRCRDVKATAKALGITINDLVLATAAGGLRTLLLAYDGAADRPIIASVPTATDKSDRITGNEISGLMISLPVHVADPVERARLVALATRIAKEDHEILGPRALRPADGLPADRVRPGRIPVAGSARRAEQADERRGLQRGGAA